MARRLEGFDPLFQQVTERALELGEAATWDSPALMRIPCESRGQAINVEMQLRQYWKALMAARDRGELGDAEYDPRARLAERVATLATRAMKGQPLTVEIILRSQLSTARAIAGALGGAVKPLTKAIPPKAASASPAGAGGAAAATQEDILAEITAGGGKPGK